ncbi:hypothetical protein F444_10461 [Phytophthora nicotianae P1976]|uniref:Uncharacterized protein n=1 Tax=Phytophthora nicotianae P1976 TaxID=1317066 RepID=A0A081A3Z4_PHYNI|nr:hypothetical protein F444_10461 [Phytophthora nicotianae P1976]
MQIPEVITRERTNATAMETLCIILYKPFVPVRWYDIEDFFSRSSCGLSNIFLHLLKLLDVQYSDLLQLNRSVVTKRLDV